MLGFLHRAVAFFEALFKGALFDCKMCGQCLLSDTKLVCPMRCPKGLRNGPCGGTIDGRCEVFPDRRCVHVDIFAKTGGLSLTQGVHAPFEPTLMGTSSYLNLITRRDRQGRALLPFSPPHRAAERPPLAVSGKTSPTSSTSSGWLVTAELRSPASAEGMKRARQELSAWGDHVHAVNATSGHAGKKTISAIETAREILARGMEPIVQVCGRDVSPEALRAELDALHGLGMRNILCITGDWARTREQVDRKRISRRAWQQGFFPMDAAQMVRQVSQDNANRPRPLAIGVAANPYSDGGAAPAGVALGRTLQKIACGATFVQTQCVISLPPLARFLEELWTMVPRTRLTLLASVPVIGTPSALATLRSLPGVVVPESTSRRITEAANPLAAGLALARETILGLRSLPVDGIHLMTFGAPAEAIAELAWEAGRLRGAAGVGAVATVGGK